MRPLIALLVGIWASTAGAATAARAGAACADVFDAWPMPPTNAPTPAVGLGRFNEDDLFDAAILGGQVLSVLIGNGDGTFQTVETALAGSASGFVVGDFNGDQAADVAVASGANGAVLIGNGDGTFGPAQPFATSGFTYAMGVGYMNADPFLDLVVGGVGLYVFLGHGDGTFEPPIPYATDGILNSLAVADLDGDGHADVSTTADQSNSVQIYPGNGDGTLEPPLSVVAGLNLSALSVADLAGGPQPDLLLVADGLVGLLIGDGEFNYQAAQLYDLGSIAVGVAAGDLDGDGDREILASSADADFSGAAASLSVLENLGGGSFDPEASYSILAAPTAPAAGDLDGDGLSDVVVASTTQSGIVVLPNTDGVLRGARLSLTEPGSTLAAGDFDEDGLPDIILSGIRIALGDGGGLFHEAPTQPSPAGVLVAAAADVDGDGHLDVVGARDQFFQSPTSLVYYRGLGDGTFETPVFFAAPGITTSASGIVVADFDGDTKLDAAMATLESSGFTGQVSVYLGDGLGTFVPSAFLAVDRALYSGLATADFDGDGVLDLATAGIKFFFPDSKLFVFIGQGDGTFDVPLTTAQDGFFGPLRSAEILQPGVSDILVGGVPDIVLLPGNDDGTFGPPTTVAPLRAVGMTLADIDADGVLDVLATTATEEAFVRGLGSGAFAEPVLYAVSGASGEVLVADFDRNGFLDSAVTSTGVAVLRNGRLGVTVPDASSILGSAGFLRAFAGGSGSLTYQWRKGGVPLSDGGTITGSQTPVLTIDPVSFDDAGSYDVVVTDECGDATSNEASLAVEFADVPLSSLFHDDILAIATEGIAAGCGGGNYCPTSPVRRDQMAVFLLKAEHGSDYTPPACAGVFSDVPCPSTFADWIEQLAAEGVTGGCGTGIYCPANSVTRAQMAIFLLKTSEGSGYTPPPATGIFDDVPVGSFGADFIEELYDRGITGGCSFSPLLYCPGAAVLRQQMATFLVRTFFP